MIIIKDYLTGVFVFKFHFKIFLFQMTVRVREWVKFSEIKNSQKKQFRKSKKKFPNKRCSNKMS